MAVLDGDIGSRRRGEGADRVGVPRVLRAVPPAAWLLVLFLLFLPAFANEFIQTQIFGWGMILGMVALCLMFLAGYGGMVSLV